MGCGASKGGDVAPSAAITTGTPKPSVGEFSPDTKPRQGDPATVQARAQESREAARRVDQIVKSGASEFDDEPAGPLQVSSVPALPPPPITPPVGAQKPLYPVNSGQQTGGAAADEPAETSYFPEQVTLNIGGAGFGKPAAPAPYGNPPAQSSSLQSFQPAQSSSLQSFQPVAPSPTPPQQQQEYPQQQLYQQQHYQQQQSSSLPALGGPDSQRYQQQQQQQFQGLPSQQAPPPMDDDEPAHQPPAAAPPADDIWSSLQNTYRIKEPPAGPTSAHSHADGVGGGAVREVLVLGDDDPFSGGRGMPAPGAMNRTSGYGGRGGGAGGNAMAPPPRPAVQPVSGGWGAGDMAQAGELMIGAAEDDWLENGEGQLPPPQFGGSGGYGGGGARYDDDDRQPAANLNKAPLAQGRHADDVMCEDIEDMDMMLEDEMQRQGLSDKNIGRRL